MTIANTSIKSVHYFLAIIAIRECPVIVLHQLEALTKSTLVFVMDMNVGAVLD